MFKKISNSARSLSNVRVLCACGILAAVFVVLYAIKLPLSANLRITFTFIPLAVAGWLFGPVPATIVGLVGDITGFFLFPSDGAYFPGFTLSTMLTGFIFGIFLYRIDMCASKSIVLIVISKIIISLFINILMNSLWLTMMYGNAVYVYMLSHTIKNAIALPFECIFLWLIGSVLSHSDIKKMYNFRQN